MEPDDGEHHPRQRRNALEESQHWRDEILRGSRLADDHCQNAAENEGAEQSAENSAGSQQHVDQKGSSGQDLDGAREDLRDRREQIVWKHHGQDLPTRRERDQAGGGLQKAHGARVRHCIDLT